VRSIAANAAAVIENGFAFLPDEASSLADYLGELTAFPAGRYDDQVDSTAQLLARARRRRGGEGWVEFYGRQLAG
jgi:predicted phage terminase large subunit-like protein